MRISIGLLEPAVRNVYRTVSDDADYIDGKTALFVHRCLEYDDIEDGGAGADTGITEQAVREVAFAQLDVDATARLLGALGI